MPSPSDLDRARIEDFDGQLASPMTAHPKVDPGDRRAPLLRRRRVRSPVPPLPRGRPGGQARAHPGDRHPPGDDDARLRGHRDPSGLPRPPDPLRSGPRRQWAIAPLPLDARRGRPVGADAPHRRERATSRWIAIDPATSSTSSTPTTTATPSSSTCSATTGRSTRHPAGRSARALPALTRWTIDPAANRVNEEPLDDAPAEFPRIDESVSRAHAPLRVLHAPRRNASENPPLAG